MRLMSRMMKTELPCIESVPMNRSVVRSLGILFWIAVLVAGFAWPRSTKRPESEAARVSLAHYFAGPTARISALDPTARLRVHDPVFFHHQDGTWSQIGYVESTSGDADEPIMLSWYGQDVSPDDCQLVLYRTSGRLEEVVATMLPAEKRRQIQQRLAAVMSTHGDELAAAFAPLVQASLRRSLPIIEEEFQLAVKRHRAEIDRLGERWNDEVISERLIPLARREIIPIVRTHGEPTVEQIGRELWDRASLWRFGWRAAYDKSPLPRKDLLQEEWDRFVEEEAVGVFERRMDEIVLAVQSIVTDVAANQVVRRELADVAGGIASDPRTRQLVREILKETLIENERLRQVWSSVWSSDEARRALDLAGDRLEPVERQIGDDLFGTPEEGINPNFARVLRNQILRKDRRWIVAQRTNRSSASPIATIQVARHTMPYPIVYLADRGGASRDVSGGGVK
jgi:hypothetical protein